MLMALCFIDVDIDAYARYAKESILREATALLTVIYAITPAAGHAIYAAAGVDVAMLLLMLRCHVYGCSFSPAMPLSRCFPPPITAIDAVYII